MFHNEFNNVCVCLFLFSFLFFFKSHQLIVRIRHVQDMAIVLKVFAFVKRAGKDWIALQPMTMHVYPIAIIMVYLISIHKFVNVKRIGPAKIVQKVSTMSHAT